MTHRDKIVALRDELDRMYMHDSIQIGQNFDLGLRAASRRCIERIDAILADWPEETP